MSVYCDDAVCILGNYLTVWVHAECSYKVAVFLCAVNYLAFVYLACDMLKNSRWYLNTNADINSV